MIRMLGRFALPFAARVFDFFILRFLIYPRQLEDSLARWFRSCASYAIKIKLSNPISAGSGKFFADCEIGLLNSLIRMLSFAEASALRITNKPGCPAMLTLFEYFTESPTTGNIIVRK